MRERRFWILFVAIVPLGGLAIWWWWYESGFLYTTKAEIALEQSRHLVRACESYRKKPPANGKFPARLTDLVAPPEGMKPVVEGGPSALVDPWGKDYLYAVGETDAGPVAYVWCAREEDGKLRGFGVRSTPDGQTRRFTLADD